MQFVVTSAGNDAEHDVPALLAPFGRKRDAVPSGSFFPATNVPVAESESARVNVFTEGLVSTK